VNECEPEAGGSMDFRNVAILPQYYTESQSRSPGPRTPDNPARIPALYH